MSSSSTLRKIDTWRCSHRGVEIKIVHWKYEIPILCCPHGAWNYYIYLHETKCADFEKLWLTPRIVKFTETSPGHLTYDYEQSLCGQIDMHGGITYYAKHGELPGHRCVEIGCDYQHLGDEEVDSRDVNDLLEDAKRSIDHAFELGILKPDTTFPR